MRETDRTQCQKTPHSTPSHHPIHPIIWKVVRTMPIPIARQRPITHFPCTALVRSQKDSKNSLSLHTTRLHRSRKRIHITKIHLNKRLQQRVILLKRRCSSQKHVESIRHHDFYTLLNKNSNSPNTIIQLHKSKQYTCECAITQSTHYLTKTEVSWSHYSIYACQTYYYLILSYRP